VTEDLNERLAHHNAGKSPHANRFKPWRLGVAVRFVDKRKADSFERYLRAAQDTLLPDGTSGGLVVVTRGLAPAG
jgi:predicted GIY-YIG superfamily endonuclease